MNENSPKFDATTSLNEPFREILDLETVVSLEPEQRFSLMNKAKRAGQAAILFSEFSPLNETARLAVFGAAYAASSGNPFVGGASLGLATFAIEAGAGLASASLFESKVSTRLLSGLNDRAKKLGIPSEKRLPTAAKIGFTFMGGTVVGMALEQRENPSRTIAENRRYSLTTSAWQGGVLAIAGFMMSKGINVGLDDPKKGLIIAGALAGATAIGLRIKKYVSKGKKV